MSLYTALNLVWAAIGFGALLWLGCQESHRAGTAATSGRLRRVVAVLLVTLSLFPCVSASDDLFRFTFLQSHLSKNGGIGTPLPEDGKEKSNLHLVHVLQSLENIRVSAVYILPVELCFFAFVFLTGCQIFGHYRISRSGRAPPTFFRSFD